MPRRARLDAPGRDIASRAHILLRSSEFGLSEFLGAFCTSDRCWVRNSSRYSNQKKCDSLSSYQLVMRKDSLQGV